MKTAIYLRKSRADEEAEKRGEHETLSRHRSTLLKIAKEQNLNIIEIKEELVSGESIYYRPKMIELLDEIKSGMYEAVLVMDIDRLGRGNMQDQGLILETFKQSKTKIITPRKIYDLNNEFDEEYSEFEAFMARKELKLITRRMQRGRIKSIEEGKYIAQTPPFGYKFAFDENGKKSMIIDSEKSEIVKLIYDLYLKGTGSNKIADYLNSLGYKTTTGINWYEKGVRDILKNKTYCGYVVWNRVERKRNSSRTRSQEEQIESKGLHEAIINEEIWNKAQKILSSRAISPTKDNKTLTNPLAGLIKCKSCGHTMVGKYATTQKDGYVKYIKCTYCKDVSSVKLHILENEIINALYDYLSAYRMTAAIGNVNSENVKMSSLKQMLNSLKKEHSTLLSQKENLHDFLERGIYDVDTYLERSRVLSEKIDANNNSIKKVEQDLKLEDENSLDINEAIKYIENVLQLYPDADTALEKNNLLKSVINKIEYYKEPRKRNAKFEIDLDIKLS